MRVSFPVHATLLNVHCPSQGGGWAGEKEGGTGQLGCQKAGIDWAVAAGLSGPLGAAWGAERVGRAGHRSPCSLESPPVSSVSCMPTMGCRASSAPPQMKRSGPGGPVVKLGPMPRAPPAALAVLRGDSLQSVAGCIVQRSECT